MSEVHSGEVEPAETSPEEYDQAPPIARVRAYV